MNVTSNKNNNHLHTSKITTPVAINKVTPDWNWKPPDLSKVGSFYKQRVANLEAAVTSLGKGY